MNRRGMLAAAAGAALTARAGAAQGQDKAVYDYLFLDLKTQTVAARRAALTARLAAARKTMDAAGGQILGVFTPQLGWSSEQLAVLIRWAGQPADAVVAAITGDADVARAERHRLRPTLRPQTATPPQAGGIYVHRWFEINAADEAEFVKLSGEGWVDFERRFATKIFGLFAETGSSSPLPAGQMRMLLLTRYADHGVWEASRDPTTDAMVAFARRQQITIRSRGCSTLLAALPG